MDNVQQPEEGDEIKPLAQASQQYALPNLIGSIKIETQNLEMASQRIADCLAKSLDETQASL